MFRLFLIALFLYLIILSGGYLFLYSRGIIGPGFFENSLPDLEILEMPAGIGLNPAHFRIRASDTGSGLDEIVVRAQQAKRKIDVFSHYYSQRQQKDDTISFDISGQDQGLREGSVQFSVLAFDKSFFNNKAIKTFEIPVNYRKPRLEVVSVQHNVNQGGVEFAFYKLVDNTAVRSGVRVGDLVFPGYPAKLLDPGFESMPEVFFSFFAVPASFDSDRDSITAFAANGVGNINLASFYYHIIPRRYRAKEVSLGEYFVRSKLEELLSQLGGNPEDLPLDLKSLVSEYRELTEKLHKSEDKEFGKFAQKSVQQQLWKVPFQRPFGGAVKIGFGEKVKYVCEGMDAGEKQNPGIALASTLRNSVYAANDGRVVYAGYFGTYGNSIIVDHGFGLFSLYGHLSSIKVETGAMVLQGAEIGRTGTSGIADSDYLHFEMRLHAVPVNPIEWWDTRWINDHIIAKTHQVLGQVASQPAGEEE